MRKSPGRSGAVKVQIAERRAGRDVVLEHVGTAHDEAELAALMEVARGNLYPGQGELTLEGVSARPPDGQPATVDITSKSNAVLWRVLQTAYTDLGFDVVDDDAFEQLVLARLIEPTSKADSLRVLRELGIAHASLRTMFRSLARAQERDYRSQIADACFAHAAAVGDISLCLYDVTTLYFEAEDEDSLRKVGYSKERRVDPQVVVGLLVDRNGFPLEIGCFEGNKAETLTLIPIVNQFRQRHSLEGFVVVADAGMLSAANLKAIDEAGLRFIVGSRVVKAPHDLAKHFRWHGTAFTDGQVIDTITMRSTAPDPNRVKTRAEPVWDPAVHPTAWRAVWQYSAKRAARDTRTLALQRNRAQAVVDGDKPAKKVRFVKTTGQQATLDQASLDRARDLVGLKGYVTNITSTVMPAGEVITSYHDLWQVEQSFRMSKSDLAARPIYHYLRDSIEAHLTIVFTALAIARDLQVRTGWSIKRIVRALRPLQHVTITLAGRQLQAEPMTPDDVAHMLDRAGH